MGGISALDFWITAHRKITKPNHNFLKKDNILNKQIEDVELIQQLWRSKCKRRMHTQIQLYDKFAIVINQCLINATKIIH